MRRPAQITIGDAYPWGRSFDEYVQMFGLTEDQLRLRIVGCADGPAAFNAQMNRRGNPVISCDPLYCFTAAEIKQRVDATFEVVVSAARRNAHRFVWNRITSPDELGRLRMAAMTDFLADCESGKREGRYVDQALPSLRFADNSFDIALCSHFLFLYSEDFSLEFHVKSIVEMCRIADEARVFPLLDMQGKTSTHLAPLRKNLVELGLDLSIEKVPYEFQRCGNEMLRVRRRAD